MLYRCTYPCYLRGEGNLWTDLKEPIFWLELLLTDDVPLKVRFRPGAEHPQHLTRERHVDGVRSRVGRQSPRTQTANGAAERGCVDAETVPSRAFVFFHGRALGVAPSVLIFEFLFEKGARFRFKNARAFHFFGWHGPTPMCMHCLRLRMTILADPAEEGDARAPPQQVSENSNARL